MIPFNKPYLTGKEAHYMYQAVFSGKISGNGMFTKKCQSFFEIRYGFKKCLLTTSCTDALEMAAILCDIQPGDEVIVPSYTFVSSALAFVRQGAKIVFADSCTDNPNIDADTIEALITPKTKVIVPVHYAGVACDMDKIMDIAARHSLLVVEDAAQAIDSFYKGRPLGGIGHMAAFSFHETKNIISGEGGMLVINDERFIRRAEIIWEKGTNRTEFFRGEVNKYGWATPPLYSVKKGNKEQRYCWTDKELEQLVNEMSNGKGDAGLHIQRYKGLGEMSKEQLWETTMSPENRILRQVSIENAADADRIFSMLMGDDVPPRRQFIEQNATYATIDA